MNYKKNLEDNLDIKLNENNYTKQKYLNYLESLKQHKEIIIPEDNIIEKIDNNEPGVIMEYAIEKCGGDSSDINMDEINLFIQRINNGYNLIKYINEIKMSKKI